MKYQKDKSFVDLSFFDRVRGLLNSRFSKQLGMDYLQAEGSDPLPYQQEWLS